MGECEEEEGREDDDAPDQRQPCAFAPIQSIQLRDVHPGGCTGGRSCSRLGWREEGPEEEGRGPTGVATRRGAQTAAQARPDTPETERGDEPCARVILQLSQRGSVMLMGEAEGLRVRGGKMVLRCALGVLRRKPNRPSLLHTITLLICPDPLADH